MYASIHSTLIKWARERASMSVEELSEKAGTQKQIAPIEEWEKNEGQIQIPVKTLEKIAKVTHAPYSMLFLSRPPHEQLPIKDFRRSQEADVNRPSLNLLDTIQEFQFRQEWLSEILEDEGADELEYIGSAKIENDINTLAKEIRETLKIGTKDREEIKSSSDVVLWLIQRLDESGITVTRKGYAGTATKRTLDKDEFKGFALSDKYAPLIFINGTDWPASQVFTVIHECVHLWLGESAIPSGNWFEETNKIEKFCNQVAAEVLVPRDELEYVWQKGLSIPDQLQELTNKFKVSKLVLLYRSRNIGLITEHELKECLQESQREFQQNKKAKTDTKSSGGDYYNNVGVHLGKRFIHEVLVRTLEGRTLYKEAFSLLGTQKTEVIHKMAQKFL